MDSLKTKQLIKQLNELWRSFYDEESSHLSLLSDHEADHYGAISRKIKDVRYNMNLIKEVIKELENK